MRPLPDRLNDRLERQRRGERVSEPSQSPVSRKDHDLEVEELAMLARRLQVTPQLRVDPGFAQRLEARILAQHAIQSRRRATTTRENGLFQRTHWKRFAFGIALVSLLLAGTMGTLSAAAQATNPNNPLYEVKRWVQRVQYPQTDATMTRAETNWHNAQGQLNTLTSLTDSPHATAYRKGLANLEQQINQLAQAIQTLPAGPDRDNLTNKLVMLKTESRQMLRGLLPHLALSEQLLTTNELGRLGDTVPNVDSAAMVVVHSSKQATITITGNNLQPGAQLLVDKKLMVSSGSWQNGTGVFTVSWPGKQSPKTIGILNPDGTATQTTTITFTLTEGNGNGNDKGNNNPNKNGGGNNNNNGNTNGNGNNNDNGNNNGNGNGNGKGKGNGNGNGKVVATPTSTTISATPTPTAIP